MYLLCILNIIIRSELRYQVIIYIYGIGGSGKSQLTTRIKALLGHQSVLSTTLDALSLDRFEIVNFIGKKLVLINDTNGILKDSSTMKAYSGSDELRGRTMFNVITHNVMPEGIMVVVGNEPLIIEKKILVVEWVAG